ncbi:MAG: pyridoxal phosphate-dependent aminotransferase, partial [bacterium]
MTDPIVDAARAGRTSAKWRAFPPDVLPLWVAEMDFPLAPPIARALQEAIARSDVGYRWAADLPEALAEFSARRLGWSPDPARVLVLGDVLAAIAESLRRLTSPGDAVVITPPVYPPFFGVTRDIVGRPIVEVPLAGRERDLGGLEAAGGRPAVTAFLLSQ